MTAQRIAQQLVAHKTVEPIEPFPHVGSTGCKIDARRSANAEHAMTSQEQQPSVATSGRRTHRRLLLCARSTTAPSEKPADPNCKQDLQHQPVSLRQEGLVQQHRCLDGHPPQTVSANDGSACSMPTHDGGKTRFSPNRSLDRNLPPEQSLPDRDDVPTLQFLRSWKQSITAETQLTDVVGQTDTMHRNIWAAFHFGFPNYTERRSEKTICGAVLSLPFRLNRNGCPRLGTPGRNDKLGRCSRGGSGPLTVINSRSQTTPQERWPSG